LHSLVRGWHKVDLLLDSIADIFFAFFLISAHLGTAEAFICTMAEAAGLLIGGAGLLGLFEACMSGFERVDTGK